ncbi:hypothetical protein LR48_Vigan352s000500 [Vigna angularis]|uniref:Protein kinase domain-containing protein n=1 Tax=Phaseolus angularis TaxID=3914 RepID=A0A0L9T9I5_PHAAN|nr:hypothetical protein LR48_Vigan352s000500 [Vigna angularis]
MWSFACIAFELATRDMLFTPKGGQGLGVCLKERANFESRFEWRQLVEIGEISICSTELWRDTSLSTPPSPPPTTKTVLGLELNRGVDEQSSPDKHIHPSQSIEQFHQVLVLSSCSSSDSIGVIASPHYKKLNYYRRVFMDGLLAFGKSALPTDASRSPNRSSSVFSSERHAISEPRLRRIFRR